MVAGMGLRQQGDIGKVVSKGLRQLWVWDSKGLRPQGDIWEGGKQGGETAWGYWEGGKQGVETI